MHQTFHQSPFIQTLFRDDVCSAFLHQIFLFSLFYIQLQISENFDSPPQ